MLQAFDRGDVAEIGDELERSGVSTAIAELPVKFVRYRMLDRDVTTSASTPAPARVTDGVVRRLSAALGACDMDGVQPRSRAATVASARGFPARLRIDMAAGAPAAGACTSDHRLLLEGHAVRTAGLRFDLSRQIADRARDPDRAGRWRAPRGTAPRLVKRALPVKDVGESLIAARFSGALWRTCSSSLCACSNCAFDERAASVTRADRYVGWTARPARQTSTAS